MISSILVRILGDNANLRSTLLSSTRDIERAGSDWARSADKTGAAWKAVGVTVAAVGVASAVALTAAVKSAAAFEAEMRNVNSIAAESESAFTKTGQAVLDLSKTVPQSALDLASGLYQITSSGFSGAAGLDVLKASAQAASAGITSTSTAATAIAAVLNSYGRSASEAGDVSDSLFQTVNAGVLSFEELSNGLGHVVGQAAAAGISISDVGAAIATMTAAGQTSDIAFTSLQNLLTKIIAPTDEFKAVLKGMGFESGEAALKAVGLKGVVEGLGRATGGSLTGLQTVLQDVQAVRAASSLLAQNGALYTKIADQFTPDARAGATQRTLQEQLKSTRAQYTLLVNGVRAYAIEQGLKLLPAIRDTIKATRELGGQGLPTVEHALSATLPLWRALGALGVDLSKVLVHLAQDAAPLATALVKIGGGAVVGALTGLLTVLDSVAKVLADHPALALAVVAILVGRMIPALVASTLGWVANTVAMIRTQASLIRVTALSQGAALGIYNLSGALRAASIVGASSLSTLVGGLGGLAATAALVGLGLAWQRVSSEESEAADQVEAVQKRLDALDASSVTRTRTELEALVKAGQTQNTSDNGIFDSLLGDLGGEKTQSVIRRLNAITDEVLGRGHKITAGDDAAKALKQVDAAASNTTSNVARLAREYGLTEAAVRALAKANDLDLTKPYAKSRGEVEKFKAAVTEATKKSGTDYAALVAAAGSSSTEATEAVADAVKKMTDAVRSAVASSTDVLGSLKLGSADDQVASTTKSLQDAKDKLTELRAGYADVTVLPASVAKKLADSAADVATAQAAADKAATAAREATLEGAYSKSIKAGTDFSADITAALAQGLDPTVVAKLLQEGPEQAGPILEQIVADHSGRLVKLVNDSEAAISQITAFTAEQGRLTALATNATTDVFTKDLPAAMRIASLSLQDNLSAGAIAKALGSTIPEIDRVATEFGITVGQAVASGVSTGVGTALTGRTSSQASALHDRVSRAGGGPVFGAGTTTSDSIPAWLSHREWVIRASSAEKYGPTFMHAVNAGTYDPRRWSRFAGGGQASRPPTYATGAPRVVMVPVTETHTATAPIHVEHLHAADVADFEVQAERRRRLARLGAPTG